MDSVAVLVGMCGYPLTVPRPGREKGTGRVATTRS